MGADTWMSVRIQKNRASVSFSTMVERMSFDFFSFSFLSLPKTLFEEKIEGL